MDETYAGRCYCGAAGVEVTGPPAAAAYCHCRSCRKWHAAPVNAWAIWSEASVRVTGEVLAAEISPASTRISCARCGGALANRKPARGMVVVYAMALAGSGLGYAPAFHIYYDERVIDMADGLPKYAGLPEAFGGTGARVDEPAQTGWSG